MSMSEDDIRRLARDAQAEQGIEAIGRMGDIAVTLYQRLVVGMPPKLAATIVRDWHYLQLHKALWPSNPPSAPMWDSFGGNEE